MNLRLLLLTLLLSSQAYSTSFSQEMKETLNHYKHIIKNSHITQDFMATYKIETPQNEHALIYYRSKERVAYYYPQQQITEVYSRMNKDNVSLIRAFDAYHKAIEYESSDIKMEKEINSWQAHKNLASPHTLQKKASQERLKSGIVIYTKRTKNSFTQMIWYEPQELLLSLEQYKDHRLLYHYELNKLQAADTHLQKISHYETTDFADIGDHEDDPFFIKLINLGFISHHESNAINTKGEHIEIGHQHTI